MYKETKEAEVAEDVPSTSTSQDVNKARDILQDVERCLIFSKVILI